MASIEFFGHPLKLYDVTVEQITEDYLEAFIILQLVLGDHQAKSIPSQSLQHLDLSTVLTGYFLRREKFNDSVKSFWQQFAVYYRLLLKFKQIAVNNFEFLQHQPFFLLPISKFTHLVLLPFDAHFCG